MKYLLLSAFFLVMFWLWRNNRDAERRSDQAAQADKAQRRAPVAPSRQLPATEIVACQVCDVHLPRTEALISPQGVFCSDAHRRQAGHS